MLLVVHKRTSTKPISFSEEDRVVLEQYAKEGKALSRRVVYICNARMLTYGDVCCRRKGVFTVQHVRGVVALATGKLNFYAGKLN